MRVDRLVLEAAGRSVALDLHPRLTVVTGVGAVEREGLDQRVRRRARIPALRRPPRGDLGRRHPPRRVPPRRRRAPGRRRQPRASTSATPSGARTATSTCSDGTGLDSVMARRLLRCTAADLQTSSHHDEVIRRLAGIDQQVLWHHAEVMRGHPPGPAHRGRDRRLASPRTPRPPRPSRSATPPSSPPSTTTSGSGSSPSTSPRSAPSAPRRSSMLEGSAMAMPFILFAAVAAITSIVFWSRVRRRPRRRGRRPRGRRRAVLPRLPPRPGQLPAGQRPGPTGPARGRRRPPGGSQRLGAAGRQQR